MERDAEDRGLRTEADRHGEHEDPEDRRHRADHGNEAFDDVGGRGVREVLGGRQREREGDHCGEHGADHGDGHGAQHRVADGLPGEVPGAEGRVEGGLGHHGPEVRKRLRRGLDEVDLPHAHARERDQGEGREHAEGHGHGEVAGAARGEPDAAHGALDGLRGGAAESDRGLHQIIDLLAWFEMSSIRITRMTVTTTTNPAAS